MKHVRLLALSVACLGVAGCASNEKRVTPQPPARPKGDPVADGQHAIETGPAKDRVLWEYRTALASMRRGQFAEAKTMLDSAITRIAK